MPWFRQLLAGLSPQRPRFDPRLVHVRPVVGDVALGQVPLPVLQFPLSLSFHLYCTLFFINTLLLSGATDEAWEDPPVSNVLSEIGENSTEKHLHLCILCTGFTGWQFGCKAVTISNTTTVGSNSAPSTDVSSGGLQPDIHSFITEDVLAQKLPSLLNKQLERRQTSVRVGGRVAETGN